MAKRSSSTESARRHRPTLDWSLGLQLYVLVRCRERVAGDVTDPRIFHSLSYAMKVTDFPNRREDGLLMHESLDAFEDGRSPLRVQFRGLLADKPIDVGITTVYIRTARRDERLDPCGGIAQGASAPLDKIPILLVREPFGEGRPLKGPERCADADRSEVGEHALPDAGEPGIAEVFAGVEAIRVSGLGQEAPRANGIVGVCRRRPVEFERGGDDAASDP